MCQVLSLLYAFSPLILTKSYGSRWYYPFFAKEKEEREKKERKEKEEERN